MLYYKDSGGEVKKVDRIISEAIRNVKAEVIEGKVDWTYSPFREVKTLGKNSIAAFGEHLYNEYQKSLGHSSRVVRCEHDVLVSNGKKTEVKAAFQSKVKRFMMNQIKFNFPKDHVRAGQARDWNALAFVFVWPNKVEIWEIPRPKNPKSQFKWNNDYYWSGKGSSALNSEWEKVYDYRVNSVKAGHKDKQSYANTRTTGKEQYYTNSEVVDLCMEEVLKHIDLTGRTLLEPCGGTGEFIKGFQRNGVLDENIRSFDIEPKYERIEKANYLETDLAEHKDLITITNPPFGRASSLAKKFFNHSATHSSHICYLVPKSWRKWTTHNSLDKNFHLIADIEMPKNCFYLPGEAIKKKDVLNTIFQIWERREEERELIKIPDHGLVKKIQPEKREVITHRDGREIIAKRPDTVSGANFQIIVFGHSCGSCKEITETKVDAKTTTMYLKIDSDDVKEALKKIDFSKYYNNVAYVQSLSIQEINYGLNEYFKRPNFLFKK